ncbi:tripartite motif-containing protein 16-like protein [Sebastes fasciatus]|uniref:tripartite motif-containing protein 16-like protein n=1 Tax=Sebastes fasciatus TaxID=394691 RepID=UPI003D9FA11B
MAQQVILDRDKLSCSICLDLLKDPVAIPCGHSYCMSCIKDYWGEEHEKKTHSCPQCRQSFTPRPALVKNIMLAEVVEELKKAGPQAASPDHSSAGPGDVTCDYCSGMKVKAQQRVQDREKDVKVLQQRVEAINLSADEAVRDSEKIFTELIRLIKKRSSEVKQQIRSHQTTQVSRAKELEEKLQQEITELRRKDTELETLSHTEDHLHFLNNYPSLSRLSESKDVPSIDICPLRSFEDVTAAVSEVRDKLQAVLSEEWGKISLAVTEVDVLQAEPRTRAEFMKYSCQITLDPNTAHIWLSLSDRDRKATLMKGNRLYLDHQDRFCEWRQVLSREGLTGRCYWEVKWSGKVCIAVAYKDIRRTGRREEYGFGLNDKSWSIKCFSDSYKFRHNNIYTSISGPQSSRIGVYLDHRADLPVYRWVQTPCDQM